MVYCSLTYMATKTQNTQEDVSWEPCLACHNKETTNADSTCHSIGSCKVWDSMSQREKEGLAKFVKHPFNKNHTSA